jgi:hypothetical protein
MMFSIAWSLQHLLPTPSITGRETWFSPTLDPEPNDWLPIFVPFPADKYTTLIRAPRTRMHRFGSDSGMQSS